MQPISNIVPESEVHRMFGNIITILRFNETLLAKLERRMKNFDPESTLIGDIIITLVPFLAIYTDYCCNYPEGMSLIHKYKTENADFAAVLQQASAESNGMDVQDFCITPVQRVPRYRLLLENLIKNTAEEHPDYANLTTAMQLVSDKASEINKKMTLVESQKKMMELHRRFITSPIANEDLIQPWRYLVSEFKATIIKLTFGNKDSSSVKPSATVAAASTTNGANAMMVDPQPAAIEEIEAHVYLFNDVFVLATSEDNSSTGKLVPITAQPLWNCYLKKLEPGWTLASREVPPFQVVNPHGVWNLIIDNKLKFKTDFETNRDAVVANSADKKQKRSLIKLFANNETQEWNAVEPAPTYASNRVSTQILAAETTEFTKMALEELLSENREIFEARAVTPAKTPMKSRLGKLKDALTPLKWSSKKAPLPSSNITSSPVRAFGTEAVDSTPSRHSVTLPGGIFADSVCSPSTTPRGASQDKENGSDAFNQADVIRSTIAKLSQSSAVLSKSSTQSSSAPAICGTPSSKKAHHHMTSKSVGGTDSPLVGSPVEAKRRRKKERSTASSLDVAQ